MKNNLPGTYGSDASFFKKHNIQVVELKDKKALACIMIVPAWQGRVMTSTAAGPNGKSFGWINYRHIESGKISSQFNPFGGEERLWFGPEGGPFSIYFRKGNDQVFENWVVPKCIDIEPFVIIRQSESSVSFSRNLSLVNYAGSSLDVKVSRIIKLLSPADMENTLGVSLDTSLSAVAYESVNTLGNNGSKTWDEKSGALSLWMLGMFNPSEKGVVFIPFRKGDENKSGKIVTDDYFGKVPPDRLITGDSIIFFKTDGKHRSKIGISPERVKPLCGSYDPVNRVLTLLSFSLPRVPSKYVNSKWGSQDDPFRGDVINSYNDGPVEDGSVMGPFYEIESSSPAAFLKPGEEIIHTQRIYHITGDESKLSNITVKLFGITIEEIKSVF